MQAAKRTQASSGAAVLLVDVINKFEFPGAGPLIRSATRAVPSIEHLLANARGRSVPIVYVNDNFGQWTSDFRNTINECARPTSAGSLISQRLRPQKGGLFRSQASAFRILWNATRSSSRTLGGGDTHSRGVRRESMRVVHGKRRAYARFPHRRAA